MAILAAAWTARPRASVFLADAGSLGPIPDGVALGPGAYGAPRSVTFTVGGLGGTVQSVRVSLTATHGFVGDLDVVLMSPSGIRSHTVMSRTRADTDTAFGSPSNLSGLYAFADSAVLDWWSAAIGSSVVPGTYRTNVAGPHPIPAPLASLDASFGGLPAANANGTWILQFRDGAAGDVGTVSAATLEVITGGGSTTRLDFDGDRRTDPTVVRDVAGTAVWFVRQSSDGSLATTSWGLWGQDVFVPADFDGDGKADPAVYRGLASSEWYARQSQSGNVFAVQWGTLGDNARAVGDYDGDGLADVTVVRGGLNPGDPLVWYARQSSNGTLLGQIWGLVGDAILPGDFDGDRRRDFGVRRAGTVYLLQSTTGFFALPYGLASDTGVPGDYDGDGLDDIALTRDVAGARTWHVRESTTGGTASYAWGSATDRSTPGDYDGDGRLDVAVWRPAEGTFYIRRSSDGALLVIGWGLGTDFPAAATFVYQ
jgi:hypothetical protein